MGTTKVGSPSVGEGEDWVPDRCYEEHTTDYDAMKETLLAAFRLTAAECRRDYWFLHQGAMETVSELSVGVKCLTSIYGKGCGTVEELLEQIALGRL